MTLFWFDHTSLMMYLLIAVIIIFLLRILYVLISIYRSQCGLHVEDRKLRTILCVGSGGHTSELLRLSSNLKNKYSPRLYILATNDKNSENKVLKIEDQNSDYHLSRIPRSRNVNQSYLSSIFSTLSATVHTIPVVFKFKPNVILCNGPGTCIPICIVAFIMRCLFVLDCRIVFVESICRVRTLSLTGKILQFFADVFVVQWPQLRDACFRAKYFGRLT